MGVWARYSLWLHAGIILIGLMIGLPLGAAIGGVAALGKYHLLTRHTNPRAIPQVLLGLRHEHVFAVPMLVGAGIGAAAVIGGIYALMWKETSLFGEARFATGNDMRKAGLFSNDGAIIGRHGGRWLKAEDEENVLTMAPPRSGKGVGFVIPNLLLSDKSAVVLDMRGENFLNSAKYRESVLGHKVYVIDPLNREGKTHCYNPLSFIDRSDPIIVMEELQRMSQQIFPYPVNGNPFFTDTARDGFIGVGCMVAAGDTDFTLTNLYTLLAGDPRKNVGKKVKEFEALLKTGGRQIAPGALDVVKSFLSNDDETFNNIKTTIQSKLGLFAQPRVSIATRHSDFDLRDLRSKRITIYLMTAPTDLDALAPLYSLMFQQIVALNSRSEFKRTTFGWAERLEEVDLRFKQGGITIRNFWAEARAAWSGKYRVIERDSLRCLLILDEFKRLGQMNTLADAMSYMGGFGIIICPVVQAYSQLQEVYGPYGAETINTCSQVKLVMRPNTQKEAESISKELGDNGVNVKNRSTTRYGLFSSGGGGSVGSTSESLSRRPLLYPKEVSEMPRKKALIFKSGQSAVLFNRIIYYKDRVLRKRAKMGGTAIPVQDIEIYYAYMASQRAAVLPADAEPSEDFAEDVDFDFKAEHLKGFEDIDEGKGDFAPSSLDATLKAMQSVVKDRDASAYRNQIKEQQAKSKPGKSA